MRAYITLVESLFAHTPSEQASNEFYDWLNRQKFEATVMLEDLNRKSSHHEFFKWPIDGDDWLVLSRFEADPKGKGIGKKVMRALTKIADKHKVKIYLDASPYRADGLPKGALVQFYMNFGFRVFPEMQKYAETAMARMPR